ncbi:alpha/beta fold hydrolase [Dictyobacter aurantiacus]|uniref:Oxidoreductase n=1 Tax=Dictyobacter aurantiacus TaxID=1936993 RepID=A0A401ZT58_9CHLR|nr:alpha/beta hydrolase [Dictyobacter aurantiacus]GCE10047.1 oxidoreductase [Dictyobacter aurantiacus]
MLQIELSAGIIEYEDTGGSSPVIVLLYGLLMNGSVWLQVVGDLSNDYHCLIPTLPVGGHWQPMQTEVSLSLHGLASLQVEFLEALNLREATLVGNDLGAFLVTADSYPERLARLVITSCEAFDNIPSDLPGHVITFAAKIPRDLNAAVQPLRLRALRHLAFAFGLMVKRPISHEITDARLHVLLSQREIRRDALKYLHGSSKSELLAATERLRSFEHPVLIIWAKKDRMMPPTHGLRLEALQPRAQLVEIVDSGTLIPLNQPATLAHASRQFIQDTP